MTSGHPYFLVSLPYANCLPCSEHKPNETEHISRRRACCLDRSRGGRVEPSPLESSKKGTDEAHLSRRRFSSAALSGEWRHNLSCPLLIKQHQRPANDGPTITECAPCADHPPLPKSRVLDRRGNVPPHDALRGCLEAGVVMCR